MKKFSWGYRIAALYIAFVIMIVVMVVYSMRQKVDLVAEDYYAQELAYQGRIDKLSNAKNFDMKVNAFVKDNRVLIQFPDKLAGRLIRGTITLYKPSDANADLKFDFELTGSLQWAIDQSKVQFGKYRVQIDWSDEAYSYYNEIEILVP